MLLKRDLLLALLVSLTATLAIAEEKPTDCRKPPEVVSSAPLTEKEKARRSEVRPQGMVSMTVNEEGTVTEAKVLRASSTEAAEMLLAHAKSMKFTPRPGCGLVNISVNFTLTK